jgi:hypothetical protein
MVGVAPEDDAVSLSSTETTTCRHHGLVHPGSVRTSRIRRVLCDEGRRVHDDTRGGRHEIDVPTPPRTPPHAAVLARLPDHSDVYHRVTENVLRFLTISDVDSTEAVSAR